ncbi:uncharacterized protein LOC134250901 [Saccostrea cucullata]|uniref:uncharacterized protein LOC134250901 n=1 Tax=Saccostrea cuccullata TaxID=36930 RepID=UPI002ED0894B
MFKKAVSIQITSVLWLLYITYGETQSLKTEDTFINGTLEVSWHQNDKSSILASHVMFTGDSRLIQPWIQVKDAKLSIKDALNYSSIRLSILTKYRNSSFSEFQFNIQVRKVFLKEGETGIISWNIAAFPKTGVYAIFHSEIQILAVDIHRKISTIDSQKYTYLSKPINSKNIIFQIRNITQHDEGIYTGGTSSAIAAKGNRIHAIVYGKPRKPTVTGQSVVKVGDYVTLECCSKSTSTPKYYKLFPAITYEWYKNNNFIKSGKILRLIVEESLFLDVITCKAKEILYSDPSDTVQIQKSNCSKKNEINSKFMNGSVVFTWPRQTVGVEEQVFVTLNRNQMIPWTDVHNQEYVLKNCLKHSPVEVDVKFLFKTDEYDICRSLFMNIPDILIAKEGQNVSLHWTISQFPSSGLYSIFHEGRLLIKITDSGATSIHSYKYIYKSIPVHSPNIKFAVNNLAVTDAGHYVGGVSSSSAQSTKGILLIVAGKPSTPIIKAKQDAEYGKAITLTCLSSSTSAPQYYRDLLTWSYTWYRNGSMVRRGSTYAFTINRINMYDDINCRAKEVIESNSSNTYKIRLIKSIPAPPVVHLISMINPTTMKVSWRSEYNGGYTQYFLIYQWNSSLWEVVANISDSNSTVHTAEVPTGVRGEHDVAIIACNKIGCTMPAKLERGTNESMENTDNGMIGVAMGTVSVMVIAILIVVGVLHTKYGILERCKR